MHPHSDLHHCLSHNNKTAETLWLIPGHLRLFIVSEKLRGFEMEVDTDNNWWSIASYRDTMRKVVRCHKDSLFEALLVS